MFKQVSLDLVPLTRSFAKTFSEMPTYGGDRDRESLTGKRRIQWLETKIEDGEFYSPVWSTARLGGREYRVDGGHSSRMLTHLNGSFPQGLQVAIRRFDCRTEMDMAMLFDQFDHRRSLRDMKDKINAHKAIEPNLSDVSMSNLKILLAGLSYCLSGCGEERSLDEDERVRLLHEHQKFIKWGARFLSAYTRRCGVIAAMYAMWRKNEWEAEVFWDEAINASNPDAISPTRRLNTFLMTSHADIRAGLNKWNQRAMYVKCIHAWNAWKKGHQTDLKYHPRAPLPSVR